MSQSTHADQQQSFEPDPLLEFLAESGSPRPAEAEDSLESAEESAHSPSPVVDADVDLELRRRLDRTERMLEKSLIEMSGLKSDLATLVITVDEIRRRQGRQPQWAPTRPPARLPERLSYFAMAAGVVAIVVIGLVLWWNAPAGLPDPEVNSTALGLGWLASL